MTNDPAYDSPEGLCPHFGECGGCRSQDIPYDEQLAAKSQSLQELLQPYWGGPIPVAPSPSPWHYRNKLDFTFGRKYYDEPPPKDFVRESLLGFKRKGRWFWPLEIHECRIGSPEVAGLLQAVRAWMHEHELRAFDSRSHEGLLKILLVREGKRTGERMVVLITRPGAIDEASFTRAVLDAYPATSVQWATHESVAEVTGGDDVRVLHGPPTIDECLHVPDDGGERHLRFRLSPFSFFQTNTLGTEVLYGKIRRWVRAQSPEILYDLYGGSGGIAFTCSDLVGRVESVENVPSATEDGHHNATVNEVGNVTFHTEKVEVYLRDLLQGPDLAAHAAVVLDPPRAGLHPKALRRLIDLVPEQVLYISCKPNVFAREMETFAQHYRLRSLEALDLFPHTPHVEVLAHLERLA
jgi:23S rRNA (uracil1939-C5)-methyltransferase